MAMKKDDVAGCGSLMIFRCDAPIRVRFATHQKIHYATDFTTLRSLREMYLLIRVNVVQECDETKFDSSTSAGEQKYYADVSVSDSGTSITIFSSGCC